VARLTPQPDKDRSARQTQVPVNPGAIPDVSSDAPTPAAPPGPAREVLDVPS
jgi:hypothetical protein